MRKTGMRKSGKILAATIATALVLAASFAASAALAACSLFAEPEKDDDTVEVEAIAFVSQKLTIAVGGNEYLKYTVSPSSIQNKTTVEWAYDQSIIGVDADRYGAVITGKKSGQTYLKATANGITATCIITVEGNPDIYEGDPYIYSNFTVVELTPGSSSTVSASLYGGTSTDLEDFVWEIKDSSVADISYARGNCVITAKKVGSTQLTVSHPDAEYSYTMIVYVYTDSLSASYITTSQNIVVINKAEVSSRTVTFEVKNPVSENYQSGFSYEVVDSDGEASFSVVGNGGTAIITPERNGLSTLRVTHENCQYSLDVLVKVTTAVENVYIVPSTTTLIVTGSEDSYSVYADIEGTDKYVNPDAYEWTLCDEFGNEITYDDAAAYMECKANGNQFSVTGKKNGAFKVRVSHELSEYSRTILIILREQAGSAIDASMYITTTANYIKTQVGAETTEISVQLMGGERGDENDLVWTIDNGENNDICRIVTPTGSVAARTAGSVTDGSLYITPLSVGTATISVSHPKILYSTDIIVKVLSEYALLEEPVYISSDTALVKMLNGATKEITVSLTGNTSSGDENGIAWESDDAAAVGVSPSYGPTVQLSTEGSSGQHQTYVRASHAKALSEKKILVLSADSQDELDAMKGFYADTTYYRLNVNGTCELSLQQFGLTDSDIASLEWTSSDTGICVASPGRGKLATTVTGIASGTATVTASLSGCADCVFNVTVLPEGEETGIVTSKYLTTTKNAVVITTVGDTAELSVAGVNISDSEMASYTTWEVEDTSVATAAGNGSSAVITAVSEGKTKVKVSNTYSENSVSIDIKVGALYEWADDFYVYITTEEDTVTMVKGETKTIGAALENSTAKNGFSWIVTGKSGIVEATGNAAGTCFIEAVEAGMTEITIRNTAADFEKTILVVVANTAEELAAIRYLTTSQNVVTIGETYNETVSVSVANATENIISGYHWTSSDSSIIRVVESGSVAVFYGIKQGTAKVTVTSDYCDYPLEIIANCVDPVLAAANPYITCQNIVTLTVGGDTATLTADLVGGTESDYANFSWHCQDSSVASLYSSNETAQVKALKEGVTQIVISHPKAGGVDRTVLVICEPKTTTNCYITVTESIIKMSPEDGTKTITATLVNGDADDAYNFKWWADSYDIIDMNYTGESCVVTPVATGSVTIHCSHPKAAYQKDIILYISQYSEFAFEESSKSVTAGTKTFVNMEVPATNVTTKVAYRAARPDGSGAGDLMTVSGTNSVCILNPLAEGVCIVYADLVATASGITQATAQLLVNIEKGDTEETYINYSGSTIISDLEKGEKRTLSATLGGADVATGDEKSIKWKSSNTSVVTIAPAPSSSGWTMNNEVQITGVAAGEATITLSHEKAGSNLILYVIVPGSNTAGILLDRTAMNLILGDNAQSVTASITNAADGDYDGLEWAVSQDETSPVIKLSGSGKKVSVLPQSVGSAVITATVPSSLAHASCTVTVEPPRQIVLDKQTVTCYPTGSFTVKYTVSPEDEISTVEWTTTDKSIIGWTDDKAGTLTCYGKSIEGAVTITGTTKSKAQASLSVNNGWGNSLSLSKTMIRTVPVDNGDGTFDVDFEVSPACAEIYVQGMYYDKMRLKEGTYSSYDGTYLNEKYTITSDQYETDEATGTARGKIRFEPVGEMNGPIQVIAWNPTIIDDAAVGQIAEKTIEMNVYYTSQNFTLTDFKSGARAGWSSYDSGSQILTVVDGDTVTFGVEDQNENSSPYVKTVTMEWSDQETLKTKYITYAKKEMVAVSGMGSAGADAAKDGTRRWKVKLADDFNMTNGFYKADNTNKADTIDNQNNTTRMEHIYAGTLDIEYTCEYESGDKIYKIPVYLDIRNCTFNYGE